MLGSLGGLAGIGLAALLIEAAVPLVPAMPFTAEVTLNLRVLAFATATARGRVGARRGVAGHAGVVGDRRRGRSTKRPAVRPTSTDRARRTIVAIEVAVSVVLICGALLLFKSLARLQQVDIGARIDRVITMAIDLPYERYPSGHHSAAFYPLLIERLQAIPGVVSASVSGDVPLEGTGGENLRMPGSDERLLVRFKRADAGYFSTMGIDVVAGRGFTPADRVGAPYVTVINEALARRLQDRFNVTDPLGQSVDLPTLGFGPDRRATMTIVGVIRNERVRSDLRAPVERDRVRPDRAGATDAGESVGADARRRSRGGAGHPRRRARARSAAGARRHSHDGTDLGAEPVGLARAGLVNRHLRGGVGAARRARPLRRRRALGASAASRDRHPHGARRALE